MANEVRFAVINTTDGPVDAKNHQQQNNETPKRVSYESCRRRKIKCDKHLPCSQCASSFYGTVDYCLSREEKDSNTNLADCTYSEPVHKKRKMASDAKIELLENRIKVMEASAHSGLAPRAATDLSNTNSISPGLQTRNQGTSEVSSSFARDMPLAADPYAKIYHSVEKGDLEFQGYSADRTFIQGFKHELGDWAYDSAHKRLPTVFSVPGLFDTSRKPPVDVILPPRDVAKKLIEAALDAQILFSVIHRPSFNNLFNLVYSLDQSHYSTQEWRFLALFYAVLAYGSLFVDLCEDQEHDALSQAYFSPRKGFYRRGF